MREILWHFLWLPEIHGKFDIDIIRDSKMVFAFLRTKPWISDDEKSIFTVIIHLILWRQPIE